VKNTLILGAACAALMAVPALAQETVRSSTTQNVDGSTTTTTTTREKVDNKAGGTAAGAAGGAVAGAVVAGPVGAVVGGIAGAALGHAAAPPNEVRTYVTTQNSPAVAYQGQIEMGKPVAGTVTWMEVPNYPKYHWARLNDERVVVDDNNRVVAIYTN
jgi:outer membrane lipoprotein SlyB